MDIAIVSFAVSIWFGVSAGRVGRSRAGWTIVGGVMFYFIHRLVQGIGEVVFGPPSADDIVFQLVTVTASVAIAILACGVLTNEDPEWNDDSDEATYW